MNKPTLTREQAELLLKPFNLERKVIVLAIRGYGDGVNEIGIYDDCWALITPEYFKVYNANTDPSRLTRGVAVLQPGVYDYIRGLHGISHLNMEDPGDKALFNRLQNTQKDLDPIPNRLLPYWAFRQASNVTVLREGSTEPQTDSPAGRFWIDLHKGGYNTTSSAGCQTIYPDQWVDFRNSGFYYMAKYNEKLAYVLVNQT